MTEKEFREKQKEVLLKVVQPEVLDEFSQDTVVKLLANHKIPEEQRIHSELTDEEITFILPFKNGMLPSAKRRMTRMAVCKLEKKALAKLRAELAKFGINQLDDAIETGVGRRCAKCADKTE